MLRNIKWMMDHQLHLRFFRYAKQLSELCRNKFSFLIVVENREVNHKAGEKLTGKFFIFGFIINYERFLIYISVFRRVIFFNRTKSDRSVNLDSHPNYYRTICCRILTLMNIYKIYIRTYRRRITGKHILYRFTRFNPRLKILLK